MPPAPACQPARGISPRKLILGIILAGSILFFFFILFAGGIAVLREAAPSRHAGLAHLLIAVRHAIVRHIIQITHHK
jgi:hypothetical protein